jgi:hypothetical protein
MQLEDHAILMMARERMEEARRCAEHARVLRSIGTPRRPARVRLGMFLVRLGQWVMGQGLPTPGRTSTLRRAQS